MNVLFLTMLNITSINERGIYTDLLREFVKNKHKIYIISPSERREKITTKVFKKENVTILRVNTLNLQKTSLIEKGVGQILFEYQLLKAIKLNFSEVKFDLLIYSTPPITFSKIISYIKNRDNAYTYLLLKDIFPQNAVDLKILKKGGLIYNYFRNKEKKLYQISDKIGCMSPANVNYVLKHNSSINPNKVEVNPNSIFPISNDYIEKDKLNYRKKYKLPEDKMIFVYGGNIGKPQGIDFLLEIIDKIENPQVFFLIVGSGTEYNKVFKWFNDKQPDNAKLLSSLEKDEYDKLLSSCDVGMIFLNKYFTIPNFPSRLLSYLEMEMPIFAATDLATDIGEIIEANNCGYSVVSGDLQKALVKINDICINKEKFKSMRENSLSILQNEYQVEKTYKLIIKASKENV